jgi:hypothetical protein
VGNELGPLWQRRERGEGHLSKHALSATKGFSEHTMSCSGLVFCTSSAKVPSGSTLPCSHHTPAGPSKNSNNVSSPDTDPSPVTALPHPVFPRVPPGSSTAPSVPPLNLLTKRHFGWVHGEPRLHGKCCQAQGGISTADSSHLSSGLPSDQIRVAPLDASPTKR